MELRDYLVEIASQLTNELTPVLALKGVTSNSELLGQYTEAAIRGLVRRIVQPMRVCTGAVLDHPLPPKLKQVDLIVWAPCPAPALFEMEGFGLVPKSSAFGVLEVKRSNYKGIEKELEEFHALVDSKTIVADYDYAASVRDLSISPGLAVVCLLDRPVSSRLQALLSARKAVAIFDKQGEKPKPRAKDVLTLVNFLYFVTWRYHFRRSSPAFAQLNTDAL